ncbi:hypothetical protein Tsubulata_012752, partial [Turnera subulata]
MIIAVIFCCIFILRRMSGFRNHGGGHPTNWPLVGMLPAFLPQVHRVHDWCTELLEASHCTFLFKGLWRSNMDWLVTSDPSNVHYIMSSNFSDFPKGREFREILDILGDGIFNADKDMWKSQRKLAQELISHRQFYTFLVKTSHDKVEQGLIPVLEHVSERGSVVDLQDLFQRFTFDATCLIFTGHDPGCLSINFPDVAFSKAVDDVEEAIFYRHIVPQAIWQLQRRLGIGEEKKYKRAWQTIDQVVGEIISDKKEELCQRIENKEFGDGQGMDLLTSYMMGLGDGNEMGLKSYSDENFLRDTVISLMLAGRDPVGSALSWFFWLVSRNPDVEKKIREELKATIHEPEATESGGGQERRLFDVEVLKRLPYLHGALCESLRLYPPLPFQHKSPLKSDILPSGHRVNPRMKIFMSLYSMGRMTSIWGHDCLEFKPERWITAGGGIKHEPSYKFFAFNAGPRTCIGKDIAFLQMKTVAAAIIYNYRVQVVAGQTITPSLSIILHMKHGMKMIGAVIVGCIFILLLRMSGFRNYGEGLPTNWPLVGMLPALLLHVHRIHDWCTEVLEQSHCTFQFRGLWFSNMDWLITADPSNIHYILSSNFSNFSKGLELKEFLDIFGDGITNSDSDKWKSQRKLAQELISHGLFNKFLVKMSQKTVEKGLIPVLEHVSQQGLVVDLQDLFQRLTFDATCLIVTGHDPGCLSTSFPEVAFAEAMDEASEAIFYRHILPQSNWKLQRWLNIGQEKKHTRAWQTTDRVIGEIISSKKEEVNQRIESKDLILGQGIDLLSSYIMEDATVLGWKSSDDKFLRDTIFLLLAAGQDTTASALSWFFWLVSRNPHVERNIREELRATQPPETGQSEEGRDRKLFDVEVLERLPYLHGAVCESLRLYPSLPFSHKSPLKPDILPSGHRVNPGMKIYIPLYSMGRMTSIWGQDCLEFKPERWITDGGGIKHEPSYKFSAFSAGPRTCLGKNIAFLHMKIVAGAIIYNYNIQVVPGQSISPSLSIILHMKNGLKVKLFKRAAS